MAERCENDLAVATQERDWEWEAIGQYDESIKQATDPALIEILKSNREDERDHARKLQAWIDARGIHE